MPTYWDRTPVDDRSEEFQRAMQEASWALGESMQRRARDDEQARADWEAWRRSHPDLYNVSPQPRPQPRPAPQQRPAPQGRQNPQGAQPPQGGGSARPFGGSGGGGGGGGYSGSSLSQMLQALLGGQGFGRTRTLDPRITYLGSGAEEARYNAIQFAELAQRDPAAAQRIADMGMAPTINGVYGGGWVDDRWARGWRPDQEVRVQQPTPQQVQRSQAAIAAFQSANAQNRIPYQLPPGGVSGKVAQVPVSQVNTGPGIASGMSQMAYSVPSVASANPNDPYSIIAAQEADRSAALQAMFDAASSIGNSGLTRGVEALGASVAYNPESITQAVQRDLEARAIDENRRQAALAQRRLAEALGGTGRLASGSGVAALADNASRYDQMLADQLRDIRTSSAIQRAADRRAGLDSASAALNALGRLSLVPAMRISEIFEGTDRGDRELAEMLYQQAFGVGGGYR